MPIGKLEVPAYTKPIQYKYEILYDGRIYSGKMPVDGGTSFGQWLKRRRKTLDITRVELAQRVGCAEITISKIEADERRPSKQIAELLAEHLNVPAEQQLAFVHFARAEGQEDAALWGVTFRPPTNLTGQPTPLIGRAEATAVLRKRLLQPESRLLTLIGPPGIGKTRLALQAAGAVRDDFADGVFFVDLAPISDASLVPMTIANTLGIPDVGPQTPLERLKTSLRDRQTLLVLDNFEQILAAAPQIAELLMACRSVKLLVTSRAPLRIRQERQVPVAALDLPDLAHLSDVQSVSSYSAVTLFMERAQAVRPDFSLTPDNAATIATLCARLDGLPLAIELISARVKLLPPSALLERLGGQLLLRSDGLRDIEPRHRTLNAAIDWSYQLLNAEEQILFRRLGVFVGGWTLEAAEAVCLENLSLNSVDGLASLLDKSLIKQETMPDGHPHFTMLETIREYALAQLVAGNEQGTLQRQHADYFLGLAEAAYVDNTGLQQKEKWDRQETEHPNLRAALVWGRTEASGETGLRLALALCDFWGRRGHLTEGSSWLAEGIMRSKGVSSRESRKYRAQALDDLGVFNQWQGDLDAAQIHGEEAIAIYRELGDTPRVAEALADYGMLFVLRGDAEHASAAIEESLVLHRQLANSGGITLCLFFLGNVAYLQREWQRATVLWEESLMGWRALDSRWMIANVLANLGMVALDLSDYERAHTQLTQSLALHRELDEKWQTILTLEVFARLAVDEAQQSEDATASLSRAARLFGAAEALRETYGVAILAFQQEGYEHRVTTLRTELDAARLAATWAEGRKMTLDQAIAYSLNER